MNETKQAIIGIIFILIIIFIMVYGTGWNRGYSKTNDDTEKWDCLFQYANTPSKNIPGKCLRYFKNQK